MNILIIDDDMYKMKDNEEALLKIYDDANIYKKTSYNEALTFIAKYSDDIDLIILDWNFPFLNGEMVEQGAGEDVLREMKRKKININTIICSSDEVILDYDYPNVIGTIYYSPSISCLSNYCEIFGLDFSEIYNRNIFHKDSLSDDFCMISREEYKLGDDLLLKEKQSSVFFEEEKEKPKTKCKRKRSSDAWWKE